MSSTYMVEQGSSIPLTNEQWRGLARLGDIVSVIDDAMNGPMGAVSVDYVVSLMTLAPSNMLGAVREALQLLTEWHEKGVLAQIRALVDMLASILTPENVNSVALATIHKAQQSNVPTTLKALSRELSDVTHSDTAGLGGLGGLMRLMMDKDVQAGLRMMGMTAGKIRNVMQSDPKRGSPSMQH